jgi:lysophospholipase L1-like esterase
MTFTIPDGATVMFAGDSITDTQRGGLPNGENPLGYGYARVVVGGHGVRRPASGITWLNSGIAGNRVADLEGRWQADVVAHRPDVLSLLVGINDCGFHFSGLGDEVTEQQYRDGYRRLLQAVVDAGTQHLLLIEPFLLPVNPDQRRWRTDLDPKIQVVRDLAAEFGAHLLAADGMFAQLAAPTGPVFWAEDGVHPTPAGHAALADAWLSIAR